MNRIYRYLPILLLLSCVPLARAQGSFDVAVGFGTQRVKATGYGIDEDTLYQCTPSSSSTTCLGTPAMDGMFMGFTGDFMLNKHLGAGAEINFQPSKPGYGPLLYRQLFYDFDGLYVPINHKRYALRLEGGIGGAHTGFSYLETECVGVAVCQSSAESVGAASHFQVHLAGAVQIYVKEHFYIRPQFDFRLVPGLSATYNPAATQNYQFGANHVIGGTIWFGYNFGEM